MGFAKRTFQLTKAIQLSWCRCTGAGEEAFECYLLPASDKATALGAFKLNDNLKILGADIEFEFTREDVEYVKIIACADSWIKYLLRFKSGEQFICTFLMCSKSQNNGRQASTGNLNSNVFKFEWWMGNLLVTDAVQPASPPSRPMSAGANNTKEPAKNANPSDSKENSAQTNESHSEVPTIRQPKIIKCPHCGDIVEKDDVFCGSCGKHI